LSCFPQFCVEKLKEACGNDFEGFALWKAALPQTILSTWKSLEKSGFGMVFHILFA